MWRSIIVVAALCAVACGGSKENPITQPPPKKVVEDPAIRIEVRNQLDTTSAMGRAIWNVFALVYSTDPNQAGFAYQGGPDPLKYSCSEFQTDSIGSRFVVILGVADTVHQTNQSSAVTLAQAWYAGNHSVPSGWAVLASDSLDWGVSQQFDAGHGRTTSDPVRWQLTWTNPGNVPALTRAESPNDMSCP